MKRTPRTAQTEPRSDVYQRITNALVQQLEQGTRPWMKPWNAEHLPETLAGRERRIAQAERRIELAAVITAIREKIDMQPEEIPTPLPRPQRSRPRYVHPDQPALAL